MGAVIGSLVVGAVVTVAACGPTSTNPNQAASTEAAKPARPVTAFPKSAARVAARQALLTTDDFPAGWTTSPVNYTHLDGDRQIVPRLLVCLHLPAPRHRKGDDVATAQSPDLDPPTASLATVSETVSIETTKQTAKEFQVLDSPGLAGCMGKIFNTDLTRTTKKDPGFFGSGAVGHVTASGFRFPDLGQDNVAVVMTMPIADDNVKTSLQALVVFVRHDNAQLQLQFTYSDLGKRQVSSPFSVQSEQQITRSAYQKLLSSDVPAT
jgi:hypothetical protein